MATRNVMAAEADELLNYLKSFKNDRRTYVTDPFDSRRVVVANELILEVSSKFNAQVGDTFTLMASRKRRNDKTEDPKAQVDTSRSEKYEIGIPCKVINRSLWGENLILIEGYNVHTIGNTFTTKINGHDSIIKDLCPNIITIVNNRYRDGTQTAPPTRNSPDGTLTALPTRNSDADGTLQHDPTRNSQSDYYHPWYPDPTVPLTEYWLQKAKQHNQDHDDKPIVAILDTGIDFGFDWTLCHQPEPSCPLWFNENDFLPTISVDTGTNASNTFARIQKDMIGWNFVGTGSLLTPNQHNNPFDDDIFHKHGTRIAAIIAKQTNWKVRLMILKTQDFRGVGTLFDAFAAFDYVIASKEMLDKKSKKPKQKMIINASWGYYGEKVNAFSKYIDKFQKHDIWFVNAAGNSSDFKDSFRVHELAENTIAERYPACYGNRIAEEITGSGRWKIIKDKKKSRVVTVTTISTTKNGRNRNMTIAYKENYSKDYVCVGIGGGIDGAFPESLAINQSVIRGSSYATAYASALLARGDGLGTYPSDLSATLVTPAGVSTIGPPTTIPNEVSFILTDTDNDQEQ
jgi:hypothetical protein